MTEAQTPDKPSEEKRLDEAQYAMLCKDVKEWNGWRKANPGKEVWLEGARLPGAHLEGAVLTGARLGDALLEGADLRDAHLEEADLTRAHLEEAGLGGARLEGAFLRDAHLEGAGLGGARLEGADLWRAHLEGTDLSRAHLASAAFTNAILDGATCLDGCTVDRSTDFANTGLDAARVDASLKQLLKYNIRRKAWGKWYEKHRLLRWPVRLFWETSDYGRSTGRIITCFFGLALVFALAYWMHPEFLMLEGGHLRGFIHAAYFSVVTMTTLGFGDIHANPDSPFGQVLLMLQVLLGYVLLAALVTRFAVLFTAGGPSGTFADDQEPWWRRLWQTIRVTAKRIRHRGRRRTRRQRKDSGVADRQGES